MTGKGKRRRADTEVGLSDTPNPPQQDKAYPNDPLSPATKQDQLTWKGYCEIESEPAFFNVMLNEFGARQVKTLEVFSLDDESLAQIPKPVHGLIFLFRYKDEGADDKVEECPKDVWFANQTSLNSCASVALLNIIMNIPDTCLGENLNRFKEFTKDFSPPLRGNAIDNYQFVKKIHNSFARKMDMLEADLLMKNNVERESEKKKARKENDGDYGECYHFIAYVPVNGKVWSLDGLQRQPTCLGKFGDGQDWLAVARPFIQQRMATYESDAIAFNLLALIRKPSVRLHHELDLCIESLVRVEDRLKVVEAGMAKTVANEARRPSLASQDPRKRDNQNRAENKDDNQEKKDVEMNRMDHKTLPPSTPTGRNKIGDNEVASQTENPNSSPLRQTPYSPGEGRPAKRQKTQETNPEDELTPDPAPLVYTPTRAVPEKPIEKIMPHHNHWDLIMAEEDANALRAMVSELKRGILDRQNLIADQKKLEAQDEERAASRRFDYGPFIRKWLSLLVQKGVAKEIFEETEREKKENERVERERKKQEASATKKGKGKAAGKKRARKS